jgi:hypothetical protein
VPSRLSLGSEPIFDPEWFIFTLVRWGEHHYDRARAWTIDEMRTNIPNYVEVLANTRAGQPVPYFENLLSTTWQTEGTGDGAGISIRNPITAEQSMLDGPGVIEFSS